MPKSPDKNEANWTTNQSNNDCWVSHPENNEHQCTTDKPFATNPSVQANENALLGCNRFQTVNRARIHDVLWRQLGFHLQSITFAQYQMDS